ncbi:MAG: hypothetical protein JRI41_02920 [Deltaproteobacteria bacterium]|nr:hypothetical protein [Deltaproteobacteria bacterium]
MNNISLEEQEAIDKNHRAHLAAEAKRVLSEPLIDAFISENEQNVLVALKRLPMGAELHMYQTLHHDLLATMRFKERLEAYIQNHESAELQERLKQHSVAGV